MLKNYLQFCKKSPLIYISETRNTKSPDSHRGLSPKTYQNMFESKLHSKNRIHNACACICVYRCVCPLMCVQVHLCEGVQVHIYTHPIRSQRSCCEVVHLWKKRVSCRDLGLSQWLNQKNDPRAPQPGLTPQHWDFKYTTTPGFLFSLEWFWGMDSGPHIYVTSTSLTELYPQGQHLTFRPFNRTAHTSESGLEMKMLLQYKVTQERDHVRYTDHAGTIPK